MNKSNLSSRAMSVNIWHHDKNNKTQPKTNVSSYKQTFIEHEYNRIQLNGIYDIFYVHFPHIVSNMIKKSINENNFLQILNNLLNVIKNANQAQVKQLQMEYQNIELQLKVIRDAHNSAMQKIKALQNELYNINQKIKSKELDCFAKNQQIFQNKQKIESIQKQIAYKNLQVKKTYAQWKNYKHEADEAIQNLQNINLKLNKDNKKLKKQIIDLSQRLNDLQIQIEKINSIAKKNSKNSSVLYHESELQENVPNSSNLRIRNRPNSATISQYSQKMKKQQKLAILSSQQLKAEVNELRQNQSALLDRLAERDKIIQKLQNQFSNSRLYE